MIYLQDILRGQLTLFSTNDLFTGYSTRAANPILSSKFEATVTQDSQPLQQPR